MTRGNFGAACLSTFALVAGCNWVLGNEEGVLVEAGVGTSVGGAPGGGGAVAREEAGASADPRSGAGGVPTGASLGPGGAGELGSAGERAGGVAGTADDEPAGNGGIAGDASEVGGASDGGTAGVTGSAATPGAGGTGAVAGGGGSAGIAGSGATAGTAGGTGGVAGGGSGGDAPSASGGGPVCECTPGSPPAEEIVPCPKGAWRTRTQACNDDCTFAPPVDSECSKPPNDCDGCSCVGHCDHPDKGVTTCLRIDESCSKTAADAECAAEAPRVCGDNYHPPVDIIDWYPR